MLDKIGYRRRTLEEIINAKILKAQELFGEDIDTSENTPLGKYIRINAYDQYNVEEIAEKVYYSVFPQTSTGQSLDRHGWRVGITRNAAAHALYKIKVTGDSGSVLGTSFMVGTESGVQFYNTSSATIGEDGCIITVECTESGTIGNVQLSEINKIVTPLSYVESIECIECEKQGEDEESDYDYLKRYKLASKGAGSCNEASIISAIMNIPTVKGVYVHTNTGTENDNLNCPPRHIICFVDGGEDKTNDIAEAIFHKLPIGTGTSGDIVVNVNYGGLTEKAIKFSRPEQVPIYVSIELVTSAAFDSNGENTIKENIKNYIENLGIGNPLIVTALYSQIYSVVGVVSAMVSVSTDGTTYNANNINIAANKVLSVKEVEVTQNG